MTGLARLAFGIDDRIRLGRFWMSPFIVWKLATTALSEKAAPVSP